MIVLKRAITLVALLCAAVAVSQEAKQLFNYCSPPFDEIGVVCLKISSLDCFELTGDVTLDGVVTYHESLSLPKFLRQFERDLNTREPNKAPNSTCMPLTNEFLGGYKCTACVNSTQLAIDGDDLKFCGSALLQCETPLGEKSQTFDIPCIDIKDCQIFGCPNGCSNHGTCGPFGSCDCKIGYSGPDCSVFVENDCVSSSEFPKTCWKASFPDCKTVALEAVSEGNVVVKVEQAIDGSASLPLVPCHQMKSNSQCELCVVADKVKVEGTDLKGCPVVNMKCLGINIEDFQLPCQTLATSSKLVCPPDSPHPPPPQTPTASSNKSESSSPGRVLMWAAVTLLILALLGAGGYYIFLRYRRQKFANFGYEGISLSVPDDDEDYEPLKSPFGGSSDDE